MRAAERGEEVVQRHFVRKIDDREAQAPLVAVTVEEVVSAHAGIEQISRGNALWIVVFKLGFSQGRSRFELLVT